MRRPICDLTLHLGGRWPTLPGHLATREMHLDPDFGQLTYGDQGKRAAQITEKLTPGDILVFYAGLADIHPASRLVYALTGLFVIEEIVMAGVRATRTTS